LSLNDVRDLLGQYSNLAGRRQFADHILTEARKNLQKLEEQHDELVRDEERSLKLLQHACAATNHEHVDRGGVILNNKCANCQMELIEVQSVSNTLVDLSGGDTFIDSHAPCDENAVTLPTSNVTILTESTIYGEIKNLGFNPKETYDSDGILGHTLDLPSKQ
jgi:hypothetical protein